MNRAITFTIHSAAWISEMSFPRPSRTDGVVIAPSSAAAIVVDLQRLLRLHTIHNICNTYVEMSRDSNYKELRLLDDDAVYLFNTRNKSIL